MTDTTTADYGWREAAAADALITLAFAEDLGDTGDITTNSLIPADRQGTVTIGAREAGVVAGLSVVAQVFEKLDATVHVELRSRDGDPVTAGEIVATLSGPLRSLLTGERTALNFLTHLSGIASLTAKFAAEITGTKAVLLDTRKTHPGYRLLEKYAVRCGGGTNHRMGLHDGVLIKDNHVAAWSESATLPEAIEQARRATGLPIEVEVDTLAQLAAVLPSRPAIVLLDNFALEELTQAVALRDKEAKDVLLEASGGVKLETVRAIARTGVDRISCGALTHSAIGLDFGFDW